MKRFWSFCVVMVLLLSMTTFAPMAGASSYQGMSYTVTNGEVTITDAIMAVVGDVTIPDTIDGYPVTAIRGGAFSGNNITSIVIPDNVTSVGGGAFRNCKNLVSVELSANITTIEDLTFAGCSALISIDIPDGVTSIGEAAFSGCSALHTFNIPDSVTDIGKYAFQNTAYAADADNWKNGVLFWNEYLLVADTDLSGHYEIPVGTKFVTRGAFADCTALSSVTIAEDIAALGEQSFYNCAALTEITIPDSVVTIGTSAFEGCTALRSVDFGRGVRDIGERAFMNCINLTAASIPQGVSVIRRETFYCCSALSSLTIPDGVVSIEFDAFDGCRSLSSITIPSSVKTIGVHAFANTEFTSLVIPDTVEEIGGGVFNGCEKLEEISVPFLGQNLQSERTAYLGYFFGVDKDPYNSEYPMPSSLRKVTVRQGSAVGDYAFYRWNTLEEIILPDSITSIGVNAFAECEKLTSLSIPAGVLYIERSAFDNNGLQDIWYDGSVTMAAERFDRYILQTGVWHFSGSGTGFADLNTSAYYYQPVLWAVENNITTGISADRFAPAAVCTRGQVVTFLWRAAGCPEPQSEIHSFTDVKNKAYYYKAMLWAVEQGITKGVSATKFDPNASCTRGQIVTFLWRAMGSPYADDFGTFTDVQKGAYYYDAMLWAIERGITTGVAPSHFAPHQNCSRAQSVTFLYRCYN